MLWGQPAIATRTFMACFRQPSQLWWCACPSPWWRRCPACRRRQSTRLLDELITVCSRMLCTGHAARRRGFDRRTRDGHGRNGQGTWCGVYGLWAASTTTGSGVGGAFRNADTMRTAPCRGGGTFTACQTQPTPQLACRKSRWSCRARQYCHTQQGGQRRSQCRCRSITQAVGRTSQAWTLPSTLTRCDVTLLCSADSNAYLRLPRRAVSSADARAVQALRRHAVFHRTVPMRGFSIQCFSPEVRANIYLQKQGAVLCCLVLCLHQRMCNLHTGSDVASVRLHAQMGKRL
jgi:hypothetical protein